MCCIREYEMGLKKMPARNIIALDLNARQAEEMGLVVGSYLKCRFIRVNEDNNAKTNNATEKTGRQTNRV